MKIVVTGANGFIGTHLIRELAGRGRAQETVCLVRSPEKGEPLESWGVRLVLGDVRKKETLIPLCAQADLIFHLAARVDSRWRNASRIDFPRDNVEGTKNLLLACPPTVRRFIHLSSINSIERPPGDPCNAPLTEESPPHPQTPYGRSKWLAEEAVRQIATDKKMPYLILRPPSIVYGPGCKKSSGMAALIRSVAHGSLLTRLNFPGRMSIIHVMDLVEAVLDMGFSDRLENDTFFLCDEVGVTTVQIADEIARQLQVQRKRFDVPPGFLRLVNRLVSCLERVSRCSGMIPFPLLMVLRDQALVSSHKAHTVAGFTTKRSLAEGLRETIPWVLASKS